MPLPMSCSHRSLCLSHNRKHGCLAFAIAAWVSVEVEVEFEEELPPEPDLHTDAADAGLTDAQIRALSGHKTAAMISVYAKKTKDQRLAGARKRLEARRTKGENLSE
jgi:hypothetical protein